MPSTTPVADAVAAAQGLNVSTSAAAASAASTPQTLPAADPSAQIPWLLIGGVALAAWLWEKYGTKKDRLSASEDEDDSEEEKDEDEADEDSGDSVGWTDQRISKGRRRKQTAGLADLRGPISDTYIQPARLARDGNCDEAVSLLDRQARSSEGAFGPRKSPIVRRALKRSALVVTERCPKEVSDLVGASEELREEAEASTGLRLPSTGRAFVHRKQEYQYDPQKGTDVHRTRGEAVRFRKKRAGAATLEYRPKGEGAYRVINLDTGEAHEQKVPTGKPRGRPRKLK